MGFKEMMDSGKEEKENFMLKQLRDCCCNVQELPVSFPKVIAGIRLLGNAVVLPVYDNCDFKIPTNEQRENLKNMLGIEIDLLTED